MSGPPHDHVLRDGTTVRLRPIRPDDGDRLLAMWDRTSETSRRSRFLGPFQLTAQNVRRFTDLDPDEQFAVVATIGRGDDERVVGVARYEREVDDGTRAEFAALIEDAHQGRGVGTALVREVARAAIEAGVVHLTGEVLANNARMLRLVRELGLETTAHRQDTIVTTDFRLAVTERFLAAVDEDERRAAAAALGRFLCPDRIAVVGASRDRTAIGGLVFDNLLQGGFNGVVYPVNHEADHVQGVVAYPELSACPEVPDLVVICVPPEAAVAVVDEAGELGVRAVCVISAGFAEVGPAGAALQEELLAVARGHGMRVMGPNGMGVLNAHADRRMNATFSRTLPRPGRLGFSSQSGALGLAVLQHADRLGLGISSFVSVGNKADISGNDLLLFWEHDEHTDVILLYLESFGNPRKFSRIARRVSRHKPIVAVKSGRTAAGVRAASSHTGALASGDQAVDALFAQTGVIRTDTLQELFDVATVLASGRVAAGDRVAVLTNAGGPGILAVDALSAHGLRVPTLSDATQAGLADLLPPSARTANPVDLVQGATPRRYERCLEVLADSGEVDAIVVVFVPVHDTAAQAVAEAIVRAAERAGEVSVVAVLLAADGVPAALRDAGVPTFGFPEDAARALGRVARWRAWRDRPLGDVVRPDDLDPDTARAVVEKALRRARLRAATAGGIGSSHAAASLPSARAPAATATSAWLSNADAEAVLGAYGIPLAPGVIVADAAAGADAFDDLGATHVAVKVAAPIHKAEVGGVRLQLTSRDEVARAIEDITADLEANDLGEHATAFVVQAMVDEGVQMVVGVTHDRSFGPIVMTGMGGTLVELLQDVSVRITPLTDVDVDDMLASLRMRPLLDGYRGDGPKDVAALKNLLHRVNALVEDLPEIAELDLNPVFVGATGVTCVDLRLKVASDT